MNSSKYIHTFLVLVLVLVMAIFIVRARMKGDDGIGILDSSK